MFTNAKRIAITRPHPPTTIRVDGLAPARPVLHGDTDSRLRAAAIDGASRRPVYRATKRALDLLIAVPAFIVLAPVMVVIAIILRIESPGPALFRQPRVGGGGKLINFYKFRTMYADARDRYPELFASSFDEHAFQTGYYKPACDPRNTRFGTWIRKLTLDELPNLINVIRGEVSLVGPRPELPEYIKFYTDDQLRKFSVPSGITGLAQVSGRNNLPIQLQIAADLAYVDRCSLMYDVRLIAQTVTAVIGRVGAE